MAPTDQITNQNFLAVFLEQSQKLQERLVAVQERMAQVEMSLSQDIGYLAQQLATLTARQEGMRSDQDKLERRLERAQQVMLGLLMAIVTTVFSMGFKNVFNVIGGMH
ncbi:MAG TPA: hypothetical protein VE986_04580 [Hyphomicrobiales bacterium]|nr:hypothetical protein [Hyphomicrobiales bacterium]